MSNRIATFFPGTAVVRRTTFAHIVGSLEYFSLRILIDDLGKTLYYAAQNRLIASDHDCRLLRDLYIWLRRRIDNHTLDLPADARKGRRLRFHAVAEC